jgi:WD40 repeat protein
MLAQRRLRPIADNGSITFWDYATGTPFQNMEDVPQPGSLEAEAGVFCSTFDMAGTRLITGSADKTIKVRNQVIVHAPLTNSLFKKIRSTQNRRHDWLFPSVLGPVRCRCISPYSNSTEYQSRAFGSL